MQAPQPSFSFHNLSPDQLLNIIKPYLVVTSKKKEYI